MTLEEKREKIRYYCISRGACGEHDDYGTCPLYCVVGNCYETDNPAIIDKNYECIFGKTPTDTPTDTPSTSADIINHPSHYCREDAMESIEEMVLVFGKEAVKHFCLCNVWKYRYRSSAKNGEEDLRKSDWYMKKYKELCEDERSQYSGEQIPLPL